MDVVVVVAVVVAGVSVVAVVVVMVVGIAKVYDRAWLRKSGVLVFVVLGMRNPGPFAGGTPNALPRKTPNSRILMTVPRRPN